MPDVFELELLATMPNYYAWIMEAFAPFVRGHVVEYGAGTGTISQLLSPMADTFTVVEPSGDLVTALRTKFRDEPKVEVVSESLEQYAARIGVATADTVVMVNVLEHIEDDGQALVNLFHTLRPGGHLLIFVPALQALMSKLDVMFGHFRRYHRLDLLQKVTKAGGEVQLCRYFDFFGVLPWFVLNKVMGATAFNPQIVEFHDKFVVPVSRAAERMISPPIGKNIILAARKSDASLP
jgi:SAM-dependent methyltransferase